MGYLLVTVRAFSLLGRIALKKEKPASIVTLDEFLDTSLMCLIFISIGWYEKKLRDRLRFSKTLKHLFYPKLLWGLIGVHLGMRTSNYDQ